MLRQVAAIALVLTTVSHIAVRSPVVFCVSRADSFGSSISQEKESRTPAQQKIDSQLLYAIYQMRGVAEEKGVPTEPISLKKDAKGRVLIDIRAPVTKKLQALIQSLKGRVVSTSQRDDSTIAYLSLGRIEKLAQNPDVKFISTPAEAMTNQR